MSFFNNFVDEYKEILTMKKSHKDNSSKKSLIIKTLSLTLIMAVIALFTAVLFNTFENLGYLFTMLNGIVLGSFIIYKALNEIRIRTRLKAGYKIRTLLVYDSLEIIILLLSTSIIIFFMFFIGVISYFLVILYTSLLILFMLIQADFETKLKGSKFLVTRLYQIVRGSLYLFALYYVLAIMISPMSLSFGTILIYFLISLIYFYKSLANDALSYIYKRRVYFYSGLFLIILFSYSITNTSAPIELSPIGNKVETNVNEHYYGNNQLVVTEDEIIVLYDHKIEFYNHELELIDTINGTSFTELYQWGDEVVVSSEEYAVLDKYYCNSATFYTIVDHELVFRDESYIYDDGTFYDYNGEYVVGYSDSIGTIDDNCNYVNLTNRNQYDTNTIIQQQSDYVMLYLEGFGGIITNQDHTFGYRTPLDDQLVLYSNGHVLMRMDRDGDTETTEDVFLGMVTIDEFLYQNTYKDYAEIIDIGEYGTITMFHYTDDYIMINAKNYEDTNERFTFIMTDSYQHVTRFDDISGVGEDIIVSGTRTGLESIELEDIDQIVYRPLHLSIQVFAWVSCSILLFATAPQSFFKGGGLDD